MALLLFLPNPAYVPPQANHPSSGSEGLPRPLRCTIFPFIALGVAFFLIGRSRVCVLLVWRHRREKEVGAFPSGGGWRQAGREVVGMNGATEDVEDRTVQAWLRAQAKRTIIAWALATLAVQTLVMLVPAVPLR